MLIEVDVTQEHIDKGIANSSGCPVALAIRKTGYKSSSVGCHVAHFDGLSDSLPREAVKWVCAFDNYGPSGVHPFTFFLDVPDHLLTNLKPS